MQKQKENIFLDRFHLLNSQENTEEIIWSLSDSSEYEEPSASEKFINITNKVSVLKRKRKKKVPKNLSNLTFTVLDTSGHSENLKSGEISPILITKAKEKTVVKSPILTSKCISPILPTRYIREKSPILDFKNTVKSISSVRSNLLANVKCESLSTSNTDKNESILKNIHVKTEIESDYSIEDNVSSCGSVSWNFGDVKEEDTSKAKLKLLTKVKSFFDCHFSSQSSNSLSIHNSPTQRDSSKSSDDVEILTCKSEISTQNNSTANAIKKEEITNDEHLMKKKIRYKKDGLAYRLNALLRKQNACLSLWQHERFMAANSNFIIPKGENTVFRIQKVYLKYGCYLLEAVDLFDDDYLILINKCYVTNCIMRDTIIKVYLPFKVLDYSEDTKLVVNVCRFECSKYKDNQNKI